MKLIYLHIYKDTYSIFMQVYKLPKHPKHKSKIFKNLKNIEFNNLKEFLIVKLKS